MRTVTFFILVTSLFSCSRKEPTSTKIQVVATTGMLYDAVLNVVGDKMDVKSIMGPGVDPH
ncbi:MAG: zinc ABC transporter substrate-binding protein, partial [Cyclobacteriaceae bacterium]|nr:zinc ABC transporter substrate-binding protein [Cyclobacteriaceae bacterium HetDA_MAG_MS6]